jgi:hypothetical protein
MSGQAERPVGQGLRVVRHERADLSFNVVMIGETTPIPDDPDAGTRPAPAGEGGAAQDAKPEEIGGRDGPEPTRYGDWEKNGRCIDF